MSCDALVAVARRINDEEGLNLPDYILEDFAYEIAAKAYHLMADGLESDVPKNASVNIHPVPPAEVLRIAARHLEGSA